MSERDLNNSNLAVRLSRLSRGLQAVGAGVGVQVCGQAPSEAKLGFLPPVATGGARASSSVSPGYLLASLLC